MLLDDSSAHFVLAETAKGTVPVLVAAPGLGAVSFAKALGPLSGEASFLVDAHYLLEVGDLVRLANQAVVHALSEPERMVILVLTGMTRTTPAVRDAMLTMILRRQLPGESLPSNLRMVVVVDPADHGTDLVSTLAALGASVHHVEPSAFSGPLNAVLAQIVDKTPPITKSDKGLFIAGSMLAIVDTALEHPWASVSDDERTGLRARLRAARLEHLADGTPGAHLGVTDDEVETLRACLLELLEHHVPGQSAFDAAMVTACRSAVESLDKRPRR